MSRFEKFTAPPKQTRRSLDVAGACVLLGLGLAVAGVALVYAPAALIFGGLALVVLVIFTH